MKTILVIGATGHVGRPVARRLLADGYQVRLLVRDRVAAQSSLGSGFEYSEGTIQQPKSVERAVSGADGVHISVGARSPADMMAVEAQGTQTVAQAARRAGVRLVTYVSGSLVRADYGPKLPEHAAKLAAEQALEAAGVPFVILRPTYFMENLPRHVQGRALVTIGGARPLHMIAAHDFAAMVSRSFLTPAVVNQELVVHGPEPVTIHDALRLYRRLVRPDLRQVRVPIPAMSAINTLFLGGTLTGQLQLMTLLDRIGEKGDPSLARRLLGQPTTTIRDWCHTEAKRRVKRNGHEA